jgi:hypothetical protein
MPSQNTMTMAAINRAALGHGRRSPASCRSRTLPMRSCGASRDSFASLIPQPTGSVGCIVHCHTEIPRAVREMKRFAHLTLERLGDDRAIRTPRETETPGGVSRDGAPPTGEDRQESERVPAAQVMVHDNIALAPDMGSGTPEVLRCLLEGQRFLCSFLPPTRLRAAALRRELRAIGRPRLREIRRAPPACSAACRAIRRVGPAPRPRPASGSR